MISTPVWHKLAEAIGFGPGTRSPARQHGRHGVRGPVGVAALLGWWQRRRLHSLELDVGHRQYRFNSLRDFHFALEGRTQFPSRRLRDLLALPAAQLKSEAQDIREVERRFADLLALSVQDPACTTRLLRQIPVHLFSQDHEWRLIMEGLRTLDGRYDPYKQAALVKYLQYLGSRQEVLQTLYVDRGGQTADALAEPVLVAVGAGGAMRATALFDLTDGAEETGEGEMYRRLARGERTTIRLPAGQPVPLLMARWRFRILGGQAPRLEDAEGRQYSLIAGQNTVGRHVGNEVVVNPAYGTISRKHLIIEVIPGRERITLTDISSHGSFVPERFLEAPPPQ